jgi:hypothetical protein
LTVPRKKLTYELIVGPYAPPPCEPGSSLEEGKRHVTDIDRLRGEGASRICTYTLDAASSEVEKALFSVVRTVSASEIEE